MFEQLWFGDVNDDSARAAAAKSVAGVTGEFDGLRPFPDAARRLVAAVGRDDCTAHVIETIIESDPALTCRVLKVVNSSAYGLRTACTSIGHAAVLLGFSTMRDIGASLAVIDSLDDGSRESARLLEHVQITGAIAQRVAVLRGAWKELPAYTVGLLHDIGKLMQLQVGGEDGYAALLAGEPTEHYLRERERYGYDHALLGAHLLERWELPSPIPNAVGWHHQPGRAYDCGDDATATLVALVRCADRLAHAYANEVLDEKEAVERLANDEGAEFLGLTASERAEVVADLPEMLFKYRVHSAA